MALGIEVGLGPVHIVLDGDTEWGQEVDLDLRDTVFNVDPATPGKKGTHTPPPNFWPMSIVAKWLDG